MKHIKLFEEYINSIELITELAISLETLLDINNKSIALVMQELKHKKYKYSIYDFENSKVLGFMEIAEDDGIMQVSKVASEKGYGPLLYDISMMNIYPNGLSPDRSSITSGALNLWKYYYENRRDIIKKEIKPGDPAYMESYKMGEDLTIHTNPEILKLLNTIYYLKPTTTYYKYTSLSNQIINDKNASPNYILNKGQTYFWKKYLNKV